MTFQLYFRAKATLWPYTICGRFLYLFKELFLTYLTYYLAHLPMFNFPYSERAKQWHFWLEHYRSVCVQLSTLKILFFQLHSLTELFYMLYINYYQHLQFIYAKKHQIYCVTITRLLSYVMCWLLCIWNVFNCINNMGKN